MNNKLLQFWVGVFILAGLVGLLWLGMRVSGLTLAENGGYYPASASFDNIGGLRVRAAVRMSGVTIGRVVSIRLNHDTFRADVMMKLTKENQAIPIDSTVNILTEGLLGANYISIVPGFSSDVMKAGGEFEKTQSAMILENIIGQLVFSLKGDKSGEGENDKTD